MTRYVYAYETNSLVVVDNLLVTNFRGIKIQDITDVMNPVFYAEFRTGGIKGMAHGMILQNEYVYYVKKGLTVLQLVID